MKYRYFKLRIPPSRIGIRFSPTFTQVGYD